MLTMTNFPSGYGIGMDMSGLFPKYINIRRGAYIGLALSMALCPWELIASASVFVSVISSFAVFMGPICGLQVCDYWLIRQRKIKLSDLYHPSPSGIYFFSGGVNWRSFISWLVGWAPLLPGFIHAIRPSIYVPIGASRVYALGFPFGFVTAFIVHLILNKTWPPRGLGETDAFDVYGTFTAAEAEKVGILCSTDSTSSDVEHVHGSQGESKMSTVDAVV
jgi:nucleobase:cation symporter-1, NCS1 family